MERRSFETPLGEVWLWGSPEAFDSPEPYVLVIGGAYTDKTALWPLAEAFPDKPFLFGHIPGMHCPLLAAQSVGAYAAAYSAVVTQVGRRVLLCGQSLGGTVAMAMRSPLVQSILALEPLMTTLGAWPLHRGLKFDTPKRIAFHWNVFGASEAEVAERDYFPVLDGLPVPVCVLASAEPLGDPRLVERMPSLLSDEDRERLAAHPKVHVSIVNGAGHDLGKGASKAIVSALEALVRAQQHDEHAPDTANAAGQRPARAAAVSSPGSARSAI